jgi:hypothetical protein
MIFKGGMEDKNTRPYTYVFKTKMFFDLVFHTQSFWYSQFRSQIGSHAGP